MGRGGANNEGEEGVVVLLLFAWRGGFGEGGKSDQKNDKIGARRCRYFRFDRIFIPQNTTGFGKPQIWFLL